MWARSIPWLYSTVPHDQSVYEDASTYDTGKERGGDLVRSRNRRSVCLLAILRGVVVLLGLWGFWDLVVRAHLQASKPPEVSCNCGGTYESAMARGCKFDESTPQWLHPSCIDEELTAEFSRSGPGLNGEWAYYTDPNGTSHVDVSEFSKQIGKKSFWVTHEFHARHCVFYWRKEFRRRITGKNMFELLDNEDHIKHCGHVMTSPTDMGAISTEIRALD